MQTLILSKAVIDITTSLQLFNLFVCLGEIFRYKGCCLVSGKGICLYSIKLFTYIASSSFWTIYIFQLLCSSYGTQPRFSYSYQVIFALLIICHIIGTKYMLWHPQERNMWPLLSLSGFFSLHLFCHLFLLVDVQDPGRVICSTFQQPDWIWLSYI